ncbi:hypothetical protein cyc_06477 [Cyclospora cayetanensis]|uniref:Uncharacterized protein n=1 Tax=Cyclospora cayetanensis TaxID=88456 RepID=A0A1D3D3K6_9EIME|nr:hypothetical protein cyc_06477 [Cyclospora cayetanensis]
MAGDAASPSSSPNAFAPGGPSRYRVDLVIPSRVVYWKGPKPSEGPQTLPQALASAHQTIDFLHVDCLKGVPVDLHLKESSPDPYFAQHVRDMYKKFFGSSKAPSSQ